jgi:hypothetical protein
MKTEKGFPAIIPLGVIIINVIIVTFGIIILIISIFLAIAQVVDAAQLARLWRKDHFTEFHGKLIFEQ